MKIKISISASAFTKGQNVIVKTGTDEWYAGVVKTVKRSGGYVVDFNDGDEIELTDDKSMRSITKVGKKSAYTDSAAKALMGETKPAKLPTKPATVSTLPVKPVVLPTAPHIKPKESTVVPFVKPEANITVKLVPPTTQALAPAPAIEAVLSSEQKTKLERLTMMFANGNGSNKIRVGAAVIEVLTNRIPRLSLIVGLLQTNNYGGLMTNYKKQTSKRDLDSEVVELIARGIAVAKQKSKSVYLENLSARKDFASRLNTKYNNQKSLDKVRKTCDARSVESIIEGLQKAFDNKSPYFGESNDYYYLKQAKLLSAAEISSLESFQADSYVFEQLGRPFTR